MNSCFTCLSCGKQNNVRGHIYTNKYCNNKCQQEHRSRLLVKDWKDTAGQIRWRQVPDYVKRYLIGERGHRCEVCLNTDHNKLEIPLVVDYLDNDSSNNAETNLQLICPNCRTQK